MDTQFYTQLPARELQIEQLTSIFHDPTCAVELGVITVIGAASTGKTTIVNNVLASLKKNTLFSHSFVECASHFSTKTLFEDVLEQVARNSIGAGAAVATVKRNASRFHEFVVQLQELSLDQPVYLVFDNADRLSKRQYFEASLLHNLLNIHQWTQGQICIIFISRLPFTMYSKGCKDPLNVCFPPYSTKDAKNVMMVHQPQEAEKELFGYLCNWIVDICWARCTDLQFYIRIAKNLYPTLVQPIISSEIPRADMRALHAKIRPHINRANTYIYRRDKDLRLKENETQIPSSSTISEIDLPYCTKYIIIACYLASVIPPSYDEYLFSSGGKKSDLAKKGEGISVSRVFTQQRMTTIFARIIKGAQDKAAFVSTVNMRFEIATLVAQGFLTQSGGSDSTIKYQFYNDSLFVQKIAKSIPIDLNNYLAILY